MRCLLFLVCLAIALGGCAGQPSTQASPTSTEIAQAPSPTATPSPAETPTRTATAISKPATPTPEQATATPEPATPTPAEMTPTPEEPVEYVVVQQVTSYSSPDGEQAGYIIPGKKFTVIEEQDGWIKIRLEQGFEGWIKVSQTAYYPEGQVPTATPIPEKPPAAVCEIPHWPDRTPDRKIGCVNGVSERLQIVLMGAENVRWDDLRFIGRGIVWLRGAKIVELDNKNQIIAFDLGGGLVIQKKFTENTLVAMWAHNLYRGMPIEQVQQIGGNFCDLAVDDMVAIIFSSQQEAINPSTEGELLGLEIVQ